MTCAELLRTQAFIDGELDDAAAGDAEHHLSDCAECQAFVADAAAAGDLMRRNAERRKAPARLRQRIVAELETSAKIAHLSDRRRSFWLGAGSGGGIMALAAAAALFALLPPSATSLSDGLIDAHTQALANGREIQVVSSSHHTVKPWFAGRIAISPPVADFAPQGFALAGGRIDRIGGQDRAVVVYRHGAHEIDLFVWAGGKAPLPGSAVRHGYHLVSWKNSDLDFAVLSDMESAETEKFVALVRSEPE